MEISGGLCRALLILAVAFYFTFLFLSNRYPNCPSSDIVSPVLKPAVYSLQAPNSTAINVDSSDNTTGSSDSPTESPKPALTSWQSISTGNDTTDSSSDSSTTTDSPTLLSHLVFGIVGSEKAWRERKAYIESWWKPNVTRGLLFLDTAPSEVLLPWSPDSPPYRVSTDLTTILNKSEVTPQRIAHGIAEVFREDHEDLRWLVMGDDDSIFFLENLVKLLANYDHTKYYYIGARSEFVLSNYLFSFSQGFGGAGFVLSYPLAKALAEDMDNCLIKYNHLIAADQTVMSCAADLGVRLTVHEGFHQIDLRGDISGLLSSHPRFPLISLHHFDMVDPIFPSMDRYQSARHLMEAARADQSRMLQQTVCYYRKRNWTFSISWGYSAHIYEKIMPRSLLQYPIETFRQWLPGPGPPFYMFNTRLPSPDPCEAPHVFFFQAVEKTPTSNVTISSYGRAWPRRMPPCAFTGNHSADFVSKIKVYSPAAKRLQLDRCECCDVVGLLGNRAKVKFRECIENELLT